MVSWGDFKPLYWMVKRFSSVKKWLTCLQKSFLDQWKFKTMKTISEMFTKIKLKKNFKIPQMRFKFGWERKLKRNLKSSLMPLMHSIPQWTFFILQHFSQFVCTWMWKSFFFKFWLKWDFSKLYQSGWKWIREMQFPTALNKIEKTRSFQWHCQRKLIFALKFCLLEIKWANTDNKHPLVWCNFK